MGGSNDGRARRALVQVRGHWRRTGSDREHNRAERRADWRFLLPDRPRRHTMIVEPVDHTVAAADAVRRWQWLVEDGWTDRISVGPDKDDTDESVDTFVIRGGAPAAAALAASSAAAPDAVIVIEVPRSIRSAVFPLRRPLAVAGYRSTRRYLVTPGLAGPKRFTPLNRPAGLEWLLAPSPLHDRRRLPALARRLAASVMATRLGSVLGDTLVVAGRTPASVAFGHPLPAGSEDAILLTSGHDEGSRAVLLPLELGHDRPRHVVKLAPRPAFNRNVEAEAAVLRSLHSKPLSATLVPESLGLFDLGRLRGSRESYAGRWSAADLGYRHPELRSEVLGRVLKAATELAVATNVRTEVWSPAMFECHIGRPLRRYQELTGPSADLDRLEERLIERSQRLAGRAMPLVRRHFDLGPWNVMFGPGGRVTIIDWEVAPPRPPDGLGPAGADHLYFVKYWLHLCLSTDSIDEELVAFEFPTDGRDGRDCHDDVRATATAVLASNLDRLNVDTGFVPIVACHIWLEKALYTIERRKGSGIDPGAAGPYLDRLAQDRDRLLDHWPAAAPGRSDTANRP